MSHSQLPVDPRSSALTAQASATPDSSQAASGGVPTGFPFLDRWLGGGATPGDVNSILGVTGIGKTTLAMQVAVEAARHFSTSGVNKAAFFYHFQQNQRNLVVLSRAYAAKIWRGTLERGEAFSQTGHLKPYEQDLFGERLKKGDSVLGESERLAMVEAWLQLHLRLVDFSGPWHDDGAYIMHPVVSKIIKHLEEQQAIAGNQIGLVCIDPVQLACSRYLRPLGPWDHKDLNRLLASIAQDCRRLIAERFGCPVWLVHGLKERLPKPIPTVVQHHTYASYCRKFANHVNHAFVFGVKDQQSNCCLLGCTKARTPLLGASSIIVRTNEFAEVMDVSDRYVIDRTHQCFASTQSQWKIKADDETDRKLRVTAEHLLRQKGLME